MADSVAWGPGKAAARDRTRTLFGQTMLYVAATTGVFAVGAYLGRNLTGFVGIVAFIGAFACLFGMRFAASRSREMTIALLFGFGLLMGLVTAPTLDYYASTNP